MPTDDHSQHPATELHVQVNLGALQGVLNVAIQHALDLAAFAVLTSQGATVQGPLSLPGLPVTFTAAPDRLLSVEDAPVKFRQWVIANAFREVSDALDGILNEARRICTVWSFQGRGRIPVSEFRRETEREQVRFARNEPTASKPSRLRERYGLVLSLEFDAYLAGMNGARNCIVHRRGIVGDEDLRGSAALVVSWLRTECVVKRDGTEHIFVPGTEGAVGHGGEEVFIRQVRAEKRFERGATVAFTDEEFSAICMTVAIVGAILVKALSDHGCTKGVLGTTRV
jgi:hypothetical protein